MQIMGKVGVSIPFKRESISKDRISCVERIESFEFQFPSNGKAYLKGNKRSNHQNIPWRVSIPFKRESISKDGIFVSLKEENFVSIPFKRESISKGRIDRVDPQPI